jgi:hypothetical protein
VVSLRTKAYVGAPNSSHPLGRSLPDWSIGGDAGKGAAIGAGVGAAAGALKKRKGEKQQEAAEQQAEQQHAANVEGCQRAFGACMEGSEVVYARFK